MSYREHYKVKQDASAICWQLSHIHRICLVHGANKQNKMQLIDFVIIRHVVEQTLQTQLIF